MSFVRSKSTLTQRVIVALIGIPILLLAILLGGWLLLLVTMAITVAATTELLTLWRRAGAKAQRLVPLAAALLIPAAFHFLPDNLNILLSILLTFSLLLLAIELFRSNINALLTTAGVYHIIWVVILPFSLLIPLRQQPHGAQLLLLVFLVAWAVDTGAYFVGRAYGRHQLCPEISPKKTVEGWGGGTVAGLLVAWLAGFWMSLPVTLLWSGALLMVLLGPLGDLVASRFKRSVEIKDASTLLPGHGGFIDRFDTFILTLPALYLMQMWI